MEFYPGFEVKLKRKYKRKNMSDSVTKFEEIEEEAKSYTGLGNWTQTTTIMTKNKDVKPMLEKDKKTIFRELLDEIRDWNEEWNHYSNNPDVIQRPLNADELAEQLTNRYDIEEL